MSYTDHFGGRRLSDIEAEPDTPKTPLSVGLTVMVGQHRLYQGMLGRIIASPHPAMPDRWKVLIGDAEVWIPEEDLSVVRPVNHVGEA